VAALGGLVIYAAVRLIDVQEFRRLWRFRKREFLIAIERAGFAAPIMRELMLVEQEITERPQ
jgi:hypothetical protein